MATEKQTSANQANAQHSTGPTSQAGLDAIAHNNFRHGLAGGDSHLTFTFLEGEDPEKFKELHARLVKDHSPARRNRSNSHPPHDGIRMAARSRTPFTSRIARSRPRKEVRPLPPLRNHSRTRLLQSLKRASKYKKTKP